MMNSTVTAIQCRPKGQFKFASWAIRFFSKTNYSHYALQLNNNGIITYFDSTMSGVRKHDEKAFEKYYEEVDRFHICQEDAFKFFTWFSEHDGKGYGVKQIGGLLLKIAGIVKNNPFGKGAKRIICKELVILYLNHKGFTDIKDTDSLDLNDTEEILRNL